KDAKAMRDIYRRLLAADSTCADCYLGLGVYDYGLARAGAFARFFARLIGLGGGNAERGIRYMRRAAHDGDLAQGEGAWGGVGAGCGCRWCVSLCGVFAALLSRCAISFWPNPAAISSLISCSRFVSRTVPAGGATPPALVREQIAFMMKALSPFATSASSNTSRITRLSSTTSTRMHVAGPGGAPARRSPGRMVQGTRP